MGLFDNIIIVSDIDGTFLGKNGRVVPENLEKINQLISELNVDEETRFNLNIIAEEVFVNICSYSYPGSTGNADFILNAEADKIEMTFEDNGIPFDQSENVIEIENYDIDNAVGGLGRFITFSMADDYSYERVNDKNVLKIIKNIKPTT